MSKEFCANNPVCNHSQKRNNIKILDCTLRDGGYINNWNFGRENTKSIIKLLHCANIDFIEIGFLTTETVLDSQTLFDNFDKIKAFLPDNHDKSRLFGMITYGKFPIENIPEATSTDICGLRVIFKKSQKAEALIYCEQVKEKGYKLFISPTFTDQYSDDEMLELLNQIQTLKPYGISIVDSMGVMKKQDVLHLYKVIDETLSKDIALCFHSHNNLQLAFSNAQALIDACSDRELIIDSTVFGMGRCAGNLCTELIIKYMNDNYNGNYKLLPVLNIIEKFINPIYEKSYWGYSLPYYLSAINHCHPNYAKFLIDRQVVSLEFIDKILKSIPFEKKAGYDEQLISKIYS